MTTTLDPGGTPEVFYNRGGVAVVEVATAVGNPSAPIPRYSGRTVALVTATGGNSAEVTLPASSDVGDVVEVFVVKPDSFTVTVFVVAPSGESVNNVSGGLVEVSTSQGMLFRKCSTDTWFNR
jgi:hypothetical protein